MNNMVDTKKLLKLMPNDIELEKSILYCLIWNEDLQYKINKLEEEDFYNLDNRKIFKELKEIYLVNNKIIPELASSELKRNTKYLEILNYGAITANFNEYLRKLKEISNMRKLGKIAQELNIKVHEGRDLREIKGWLANKTEEIKITNDVNEEGNDIFTSQTRTVDSEFEKIMSNPDILAVKSGYPDLDRVTRGFLKGSLNIVASSQGQGKTSFIINLIVNICRKAKRVLIASIELDYRTLHGKMISLISGIPFGKLAFEAQDLEAKEWKKISNARAEIESFKLYRIGEEVITPIEIEEKAKELGGVDIIFIDYLQLMKPTIEGKTIREQITNLSGELKLLARKLDVPVVAISSINREYAKRGDGEPRISDLRESGQLEFDAGLVLLIHRPCKFRDAKPDENKIEFEHRAELVIAKNRFGEDSLKIAYYFDGATGLFREMLKDNIGKIEKQEGLSSESNMINELF